ncbi:MAG: dihydrolipoamide acetyltransferase family protein [Spirochaetia bacterium]
MAERIIMPKQGNTVEAVILLEWKKNEGDTVEEGESLCEVETDKATFEVPSTASGVLLRRLYAEGDDVPVMQEFAIVGAADEELSGEAEPRESATASPDASQDAEAPAEAAAATRAAAPDAGAAPVAAPETLTGKRSVRISPLARSTAARLGVSESQYSEISGSGPAGRILKRDIDAYAEGHRPVSSAAREASAAIPAASGNATAAATAAPAGVSAAERDSASEAEVAETQRVTGVRKVISERMLASVTRTAHLTLNAAADATQLLGYRKKLKNAPESLGVSDITLNDIVMFTVARTITTHPALNAHYVEGAEGAPDEIRRFRGVNLGFAVDAEKGLYVPVVRGADRLSLRGLADRLHELAASVHAGKVGPEELSGATFTVTNLGALGIRDFTPVLNPPEVAILGVGSVRPEQTYRGEELVTAPHIGLSLTFDHRATDGGPAARLLQDIATAIGNVESVLAI